MLWLDQLNRRDRQIGIGWFALLFLVLTAAFSVLYPNSQKRTLIIGSDREDALHKDLRAVQNHQYPYATRTFLGNPPLRYPERCYWPRHFLARTYSLAKLLMVRAFFALHHSFLSTPRHSPFFPRGVSFVCASKSQRLHFGRRLFGQLLLCCYCRRFFHSIAQTIFLCFYSRCTLPGSRSLVTHHLRCRSYSFALVDATGTVPDQ
jgi:hypothetical protein